MPATEGGLPVSYLDRQTEDRHQVMEHDVDLVPLLGGDAVDDVVVHPDSSRPGKDLLEVAHVITRHVQEAIPGHGGPVRKDFDILVQLDLVEHVGTSFRIETATTDLTHIL